jgi:hypothetical protein
LPVLIAHRQGSSEVCQDPACGDQRAISTAVDEREVGHVDHNGQVSPVEAGSTHEVAGGDVEFPGEPNHATPAG